MQAHSSAKISMNALLATQNDHLNFWRPLVEIAYLAIQMNLLRMITSFLAILGRLVTASVLHVHMGSSYLVTNLQWCVQ